MFLIDMYVPRNSIDIFVLSFYSLFTSADTSSLPLLAGVAEIARNANMQVKAVEADVDEDTPKGEKRPWLV